jgi:hypothetical protein
MFIKAFCIFILLLFSTVHSSYLTNEQFEFASSDETATILGLSIGTFVIIACCVAVCCILPLFCFIFVVCILCQLAFLFLIIVGAVMLFRFTCRKIPFLKIFEELNKPHVDEEKQTDDEKHTDDKK